MPIRTGIIVEENVVIGKVEIDNAVVVNEDFFAEADFDCGYYIVLRKGCRLGKGVKIWSHCTVDPGAIIGDRSKLHNHCYVAQNTVIEEDVFVGPHVAFLNDRYPERTDPKCWEPPIVRRGAKIGGGALIGPGVEIGEGAIIGMGAVVVRDVPPRQVWAGNPARRLK